MLNTLFSSSPYTLVLIIHTRAIVQVQYQQQHQLCRVRPKTIQKRKHVVSKIPKLWVASVSSQTNKSTNTNPPQHCITTIWLLSETLHCRNTVRSNNPASSTNKCNHANIHSHHCNKSNQHRQHLPHHTFFSEQYQPRANAKQQHQDNTHATQQQRQH